jgi:predicted outer membrane repeat protein
MNDRSSRNHALRRRRVLSGGVHLSAGVVLAVSVSSGAHAAVCPAVGFDSDCGTIITVTPNGATATQTGQGPYDGIEDTLVGVVNHSGHPISSLNLSSSLRIFGFDADGIESYGVPRNSKDSSGIIDFGPPFGSFDSHGAYGGPNAYFTNYDPNIATSGTVNFINPIPDGGTDFFSLEEALSGASNDCSTILNGSVTHAVVNDPRSGAAIGMSGRFSPQGGIAAAAQACGFTGFNWINKITNLPDPSPLFAANPLDPANPIHITSTSVPFNDPFKNGYTLRPQWNSWPVYWDTKTKGHNFSEDQNDDGNTLSFLDYPINPCLPGGNSTTIPGCLGQHAPDGSFVGFSTDLVGVNPDGTFVDLGIGFTWTSTYAGSKHGSVSASANLTPDDGSGDGGIVVLGHVDTTSYNYGGLVISTGVLPVIDGNNAFYLSSSLGTTLAPTFQSGILRIDQPAGTIAANFTVDNSGTNAFDTFGNVATLAGTLTNAVAGTPGGLYVIDTVGGGGLMLAGAWGTAGDPLGPIVNNSALEVLSGGAIYATGITNHGLFVVDAGGTVTDSLVNTGILSVAGTYNADIANSGTINLTGQINGDLTTSGVVNAAGSLNGAVINSGAFSVTGPLAGNGANFANQAGGTLAVLAHAGYHGIGTLTNDGAIANAGQIGATIVNTGKIDTTGQVNGDLTTSGVVKAAGSLNGAVINSGAFTVTGPLAGNGANFANQSGGTLAVLAGAGYHGIGTLTNDGAIANAGQIGAGITNRGRLDSTGLIGGSLANSGVVNAAGALDGAVVNSGAFNVTAALSGNGAGFANTASGSLTVAPGASFFGVGALANEGVIALGGAGAAVSLGAASLGNAGLLLMQNGTVGDRVALAGAYTGAAGSVLSFDADFGSNASSSDRLTAGVLAGGGAISVRDVGVRKLYFSKPITLVSGSGGSASFVAAGDAATRAALASQGIVDYRLAPLGSGRAWGIVSTVNLAAASTIASHVRLLANTLEFAFLPTMQDLLAAPNKQKWKFRLWARGGHAGTSQTATTASTAPGQIASRNRTGLSVNGMQFGGEIELTTTRATVQFGTYGGWAKAHASQQDGHATGFDIPWYGGYALVASHGLSLGVQTHIARLTLTPDALVFAGTRNGRIGTVTGSASYSIRRGALNIEPYLDYSYSWVRLNRLAVAGSTGQLVFDHLSDGRGRAGLRLAMTVPAAQATLRPFASGGIVKDFGKSPVTTFLPFGGADPVVMQTRRPPAYADLRAGFSVALHSGLEFSFQGVAHPGNRLSGISVLGGARMAF